MRKYLFLTAIYLVLNVIFTGNLIAADITVKLKANKEIVLEGRRFYISKVVDSRDTTGKFIARFQHKKNETVLLLENDLEPYFLYYLSVAYPKSQKTTTPVIMMIHSIELEKDNKFLSEKVNIIMEIEIVSEKTNERLFKYKVSNAIEHPISDGRTYGKLIERNLNDCLTEFNKNFK